MAQPKKFTPAQFSPHTRAPLPPTPLAVASGARVQGPPQEVEQGVDLAAKPRIVFLAGRGRTGKTMLARWLAGRATDADREMLLVDMDPTNATFSTWFKGVSRPDDIMDVSSVTAYLEALIEHVVEQKQTALVDLGGGDTSLRRAVEGIPGLLNVVNEAGGAVALLYLLAGQPDDLAPLAAFEGLNFRPEATALVLNRGVVPNPSAEDAFVRITGHPVFVEARARGAVTVWMPRLDNAATVEDHRMHFSAATKSLPGIFARDRVRAWDKDMETAFAGIASWLP